MCVVCVVLFPLLYCCIQSTDIAASAYGRNFLTSRQDGLQLVDVFCTSLSEIPEKHSGYVVSMCGSRGGGTVNYGIVTIGCYSQSPVSMVKRI